MSGTAPPPLAVVVLASAGRGELLGEAVADLSRQSEQRFVLAVCTPDDQSLPPGGLPDRVVRARARGLPSQRNAGLAAALQAAPSATVAFFFDDDSVIGEHYIASALQVMSSRPDVIGLTGRVLLDGAAGSEVSRGAALSALSSEPPSSAARPAGSTPISGLYGCNFAFRLAGHDERFDERLPLYAWLEDRDFSERLKRRGLLVKAEDCVVVHRGVRSGGRTAHLRLGYSQVMNPAYLHRSGSFSLTMALLQVLPRAFKNLVLSARPGSPGRWRRRRLRGNALALVDVARGRCTPERVLDLPR